MAVNMEKRGPFLHGNGYKFSVVDFDQYNSAFLFENPYLIHMETSTVQNPRYIWIV